MDIRQKRFITHEDVVALNFIRSPGRYYFRRHFRCGLRSHIMEMLDPPAIKAENQGVLKNGIRCFPKARPLKMLRIYRTRFNSMNAAREETRRFKKVITHLDQRHLAMSQEFLVDYREQGHQDVLLCGLQEYIEGEPLDPWGTPPRESPFDLPAFCDGLSGFIRQIKQLVQAEGLIPDLAGYRNLLVTPSGAVKLVDINNFSPVLYSPRIQLDDKGYPVCDKSVEALWLLEHNYLKNSPPADDPLYRFFLKPERMHATHASHIAFYRAHESDVC